jgi:metallopeptidase MepB
LTPGYFQTWKKNSAGDEQPSETLPDKTVAGLVAKHINAAVTYLRLLAISFFDMEVHSLKSAEELVNMDVLATYNKMRREMCHLEDLSDLDEGHSWATAGLSIRT